VSQVRYELQAVVNHHGNDVSSGHYTATVKYGNSWLLCDDTQVSIFACTSLMHNASRAMTFSVSQPSIIFTRAVITGGYCSVSKFHEMCNVHPCVWTRSVQMGA